MLVVRERSSAYAVVKSLCGPLCSDYYHQACLRADAEGGATLCASPSSASADWRCSQPHHTSGVHLIPFAPFRISAARRTSSRRTLVGVFFAGWRRLRRSWEYNAPPVLYLCYYALRGSRCATRFEQSGSSVPWKRASNAWPLSGPPIWRHVRNNDLWRSGRVRYPPLGFLSRGSPSAGP